MALNVEEIARLLNAKGERQYGHEAVSQLDHALQCAQLAEQAGETAETVTAALLHDLGHLLAAERDAGDGEQQQRDDLHQYIALPFLRSLFAPAVLEPIRLHVDAKRFLCTTEPAYWHGLSPASRRSLELQGGAFTLKKPSASWRSPSRPRRFACDATTTKPSSRRKRRRPSRTMNG